MILNEESNPVGFLFSGHLKLSLVFLLEAMLTEYFCQAVFGEILCLTGLIAN
jgi:hypothetical protein